VEVILKQKLEKILGKPARRDIFWSEYGQFKSADLLSNGARKCSLFMTKQLALQEAGWNCCTVHLHKRTVLPTTAVVNRAGDQPFPRSRFTEQQNR
jgi:hypothetical protein